MGGVETALILALRIGLRNSIQWPMTLMAVLAALLLAMGVLEQYLAIWKHRSVEGISFLFCGIDALGDLTSIISVIFESQLSVVGLVVYGVELFLWLGVFACGGYYKLVPWVKKQAARGVDVEGQHEQHEIALHDLPSSSSVFRIASGEAELRARHPIVGPS